MSPSPAVSSTWFALGIEKEVVVTGGGAKNIGLVRAIEDKVGFPSWSRRSLF